MARDQMRRDLFLVALFGIDLGGLCGKLGGHDAHALGARQIEAAACRAEAAFGLAAEKFGNRHDDRGVLQASACHLAYMSNAKMH